MPPVTDEDLVFDVAGGNDQEEEEDGFTIINEPSDIVEMPMFLAYEKNLCQLASMSPPTICDRKGCGQPVTRHQRSNGTAVVFTWVCFSLCTFRVIAVFLVTVHFITFSTVGIEFHSRID